MHRFLYPHVLDGQMDEVASQSLVNWSEEKTKFVRENVSSMQVAAPTQPLQSGIVSCYGLQLSALDISDWAGRLVRPVNLPSSDPAGFAVAGANRAGLRGSSPISPSMVRRLPNAYQSSPLTDQPCTYVDFSRVQYEQAFAKTAAHKGIDPNLSLVSIVRISRHQNASIVSHDAWCFRFAFSFIHILVVFVFYCG